MLHSHHKGMEITSLGFWGDNTVEFDSFIMSLITRSSAITNREDRHVYEPSVRMSGRTRRCKVRCCAEQAKAIMHGGLDVILWLSEKGD